MVKEGHVVDEFMLGNTHVKICDDCCRDVTREQVNQILDDIAKIAMREYAENPESRRRACSPNPIKVEVEKRRPVSRL